MRALDPILIAVALILVPVVAWAFGRFAGRRDMSIVRVVGGAAVLALLLLMAKLLAVIAGDFWLAPPPPQSLPAVFESRAAEFLANPEFAAFLVVLSVFIAMVAWSSTPADKASAGPAAKP